MSTRLAVVIVLALALSCAFAASVSAAQSRAGGASSDGTVAVAAHDGVLKRGSRGPLVVQLQRRLELPADGVFGPQTARAVRHFQARKGLTVDGIVGPQTASALGVELARGHSAGSGARDRSVPPALERIARCESGGDPRAVSSNGAYRGKYQFDRQTWHAMGGHGDPARASEAEQDRRALTLFRARGAAPWPACGA